MNAHTPGPWEIKGPASAFGCVKPSERGDFAVISGGQIIAEAFAQTDREAFQDAGANARLIAAAPEMAALLDEIHAVRGTGRHVVIGRIPALLKKAGVR